MEIRHVQPPVSQLAPKVQSKRSAPPVEPGGRQGGNDGSRGDKGVIATQVQGASAPDLGKLLDKLA